MKFLRILCNILLCFALCSSLLILQICCYDVLAVQSSSISGIHIFPTDENGILHAGEGNTEIFIYPGYSFKILDALITNFHLPESTLLMLVSALAGKENIMNAYEEAVKEKYRFFSFGDAMFIE